MQRRDLIITTILFLLFWQLLAMVVHRDILPTPIQVVIAIVTQFGALAANFIASALRVIISVIIAICLAVPAGLAMGQMPRLNRIFAPIAYILYPIPKIVF